MEYVQFDPSYRVDAYSFFDGTSQSAAGSPQESSAQQRVESDIGKDWNEPYQKLSSAANSDGADIAAFRDMRELIDSFFASAHEAAKVSLFDSALLIGC